MNTTFHYYYLNIYPLTNPSLTLPDRLPAQITPQAHIPAVLVL